MNLFKNYGLAILLSTITICGFSQKKITGSVTDINTGEPILFATVTEKGTTNSVSTEHTGTFTFLMNSDSITINVDGYKLQSFSATKGTNYQLSTSEVSINTVVISNSKEAEIKKEVPIAISTVSTQTLEDNKPTSIDQVLNQHAGVLMVNLGSEQHSMSIRQPMSYGASYLYLEDGLPIRASGVFNHNALLEINMANTKAIEIIRGPASSLYGSEAIGGAVNFISKKPSLKPTAGINLQANTLGYKRSDFYASSTVKKFGVRLSGYYANQSDGIIEHSDFSKLALTLATQYQVNKKTNINLTGSYIDYYADMRGSLDSTKFFDKKYASNQTFTNRDVNSLRTKFQLNRFWNSKSKSSFALYYRQNSIKQNPSYRVKNDGSWGNPGDPTLAHGELNNNSFNSYGGVFQQQLKLLKNKGNLIAGASFDYSPNLYEANYLSIHRDTVNDVYDSFTLTDSLLANYTTNLSNAAIYSQFSYNVFKDLKVSIAGRYDYFVYDYKNSLDSNAFSGVADNVTTFGKFTPKVGVNYNPLKFFGMYANYGQGYTPPQVSELYRGVKVPNLRPAYYNNYEIGSWFTLLKNKAKIELTFYQMDGVDEIISVRLDNNAIEKRNAGMTMHRGIEYTVNYKIIKGLLFRFSGTNAIHEFTDYVEEGTDYAGKEMALAPKFYFNTQLTYKPAFIKGFRVSAEWQHVDKYFMENLNTKTYDGYDVFNIRLGYKWKMIEGWMNILNVSDALYATTASASKWGESYSSGTPRHFMFGVAYKFSKK